MKHEFCNTGRHIYNSHSGVSCIHRFHNELVKPLLLFWPLSRNATVLWHQMTCHTVEEFGFLREDTFSKLKAEIMASSPMTSWQIDGETVTDFIFEGYKITADGDCGHEIKRSLLLWRKVMTHLGRILKGRDITLPTKFRIVKAMVFPVVMYGCESWTIKKAEYKELMLLNCGVGEDSWESLGLQGDPTSQT